MWTWYRSNKMIKNGVIYRYYFAQLMVINMVDEEKKERKKKSCD